MAIPERDTVYTTDTTGTNRSVYTRESSSTGWFVGIIVALALLAIGYLVFSANSGTAPATTNVDVNNTPAVTAPADTPATAPAPMTEAAPAGSDAAAPMTAPANDTAAPAANDNAAAPATTEAAPAAAAQ